MSPAPTVGSMIFDQSSYCFGQILKTPSPLSPDLRERRDSSRHPSGNTPTQKTLVCRKHKARSPSRIIRRLDISASRCREAGLVCELEFMSMNQFNSTPSGKIAAPAVQCPRSTSHGPTSAHVDFTNVLPAPLTTDALPSKSEMKRSTVAVLPTSV